MSGLKLKLRPQEQIMINGVVIENGARSAQFRILTDGANILRMRDAIAPETATTPLRRAYYYAQLAVAGELTPAEAAALVKQEIADGHEALSPQLRAAVEGHMVQHDFYAVMRDLSDIVLGVDKSTRGPGKP